MQLYSYFRSSAAFRVRIALNLKALPYEMVYVNLSEKEQHSTAFLDLNPQGLVPVLCDEDNKITQSIAILEYLEEKYPHTKRLLPMDIALKAHVRAFVQTIACDIHPLNNLRVLNYLKMHFYIDDQAKNKWYHHWLLEGFYALEKQLQKFSHSAPYCFGDEPTFADVCLIPQLYNARRFACDINDFPRLIAIEQYCLQQAAFINASPEKQLDFK